LSRFLWKDSGVASSEMVMADDIDGHVLGQFMFYIAGVIYLFNLTHI
jgi:hypothetical protein